MPAASPERAKAKANGLSTYFTGKPCHRGHVAARLVSGHQCLECKASNQKRWNEANQQLRKTILQKSKKKAYQERRDSILQKNKEWRQKNPEKIARSTALYREANRENAKARTRAWRKANPEKVRDHANRRRVRKINAEGQHTVDDVRAIRSKQKDRCASCQKRLNNKGQVDHIKPLSKGGTDWPSNIQLLCAPCNLSKNARDPIEWAQLKGKLL